MKFFNKKILFLILGLFFISLISIVLILFYKNKNFSHYSSKINSQQKENKIIKKKSFNFKVYFAPQDSINKPLIEAINNSKKSIDIAVFFFWSSDLLEALEKAKSRGVQIRILTDKSEFKRKNSLIPKINKEKKILLKAVKGYQNKGIMHSKFAIFDQKEIYIGSYNWLNGPNCDNYENAVFLSDKYVINEHQKIFDNIWNNQKENKVTKINYKDDDKLEVYFSPRGGTKERLSDLIKNSQKIIKIAVLDLSSADLIKDLEKAKNKGVEVRIITDKWHAFYKNKEITQKLIQKGFAIKAIRSKNKGMMHHKFALFDDKVLITGSYNWNDQAELWNYENSVLFFQKEIIDKYQEEFDKIWTSN